MENERPAGENNSETRKVTRRSFLAAWAGVFSGLITLALGIPFVASIVGRPVRSKKSGLAKVASLDSLPIGQPVGLKYAEMAEGGYIHAEEPRDVWAVRTSASAVTVFSPICPHLGCRYHWDPGSRQFLCPCHGSVFTPEGRVVAGPSPRSLDVLPTEIRGGDLYVEWQVLELGTSAKTVTRS